MTQLLPTFGPTLRDRDALAAAIGVESRELVHGLPIQMVSCGVPFVFVPMTTRKAVDAVALDRRALAVCMKDAGLEELPVFFFTTETTGGEETVYSRMLAPAFGIAEDPATGGASGPLGCYLVHYRIVAPDRARRMLSLQGVAMGRPSRIFISIETANGAIARVRVGGTSVMVGTGEIQV